MNGKILYRVSFRNSIRSLSLHILSYPIIFTLSFEDEIIVEIISKIFER